MENKIETPLQRLIAELNKLKEKSKTDEYRRSGEYRVALCHAIDEVEMLLPYEREVIEKNAKDFFYWWYNQTKGTNTEEAAQQFFNKTFQTNE